MIRNFLKTTAVSIVIGILLVLGTSNIADAQKRGDAEREAAPPRTSEPKQQRQQVYRQQQTQNQQRFEQRQQKYQQTQEQRASDNGSLSTYRDQSGQKSGERPKSKSGIDNWTAQTRQIGHDESQQIKAQQQQWHQSEQGWQKAYSSRWQNQQKLISQREQLLRQQNRPEQLAFQQAYWERVREDQLRLQTWRFYNDVALNYSYSRGARYYYTSEYGMSLLLDAVNDGYQQGFLAGQSDREDGWKNDYRDAFAYQDATYGYNGYWIALDEYQYYFQQGFQRGYDDGYYNRYKFGTYTNGSYLMLDGTLKGIIDFSFIAG